MSAPRAVTPPGVRWILVLGVAGFAAGFIGPLIFVPEANQGPMVGIFISGPAGVVAGLVLWGICSAIKLPARTQWRTLYAVTMLGVLATLLGVQPEPALRGYVYDGEVKSCSAPLAAEPAVVADWNQRIAKVTWAEPRAGWQQDIHALLREAPGVVVAVNIQRRNPIRENRKPWNRGSQFASGWSTQPQDTLFYAAGGDCEQYPPGRALRGFQTYDYDERMRSDDWPPKDLLGVLGASQMADVPPRWAAL